MLYWPIFLIGSLVVFSMSYYFLKKVKIDKNQYDCNDMEKWDKKNKKCTIWNNGMCRKGKLDDKNTTCNSEGNIWPPTFLVIGIILFLLCIVSFLRGQRV